MTSQEEENAYQKIMASQEEENVYQLPDIELYDNTLDKCQEKDNHKELEIMRNNSKKAEEMTKKKPKDLCLFAC